MLELKNISFRRNNKDILKNIDLVLDNNKFIVITGPNGSGKSTLAKIIMGLETPDSGEIIFNGDDVTNYSIDKRANMVLSYSFQQPIKFKGLTVHDLIKIASQKELTKDEVCAVLSSVGLCASEYINREVNDSLSGGELKRIEIASVSVRNSKLVIFDEPEAGIDLWSFSNLIDLFKKEKREKKNTTLIISHQEKIIDIADEIILMRNGKIERRGKKKELIDDILLKKSCPIVGGNNE